MNYHTPSHIISAISTDREQFNQFKQQLWQDIEARILDFTKELFESLLTDEATEVVGAGWYERHDDRAGYRNGYYQRDLQTKYGTIEQLKVPRVVPTQPNFHVFDRYERRQDELDKTIGQLFLAGISTRKLEGIVKDLTGRSVSHQTVSSIGQDYLQPMLDQFHSQPIADSWDYLILDGLVQPVRELGYVDKVLLCALGINSQTQKRQIISLRLAKAESEQEITAFIVDLKQRGLMGKRLKLVTLDGNPAMIAAVKQLYPFSPIQRCWVHKMRNVARYVKHRHMKSIFEGISTIFNAPNQKAATEAFSQFKEFWQIHEPKAVECLEKDLSDLLRFYQFPKDHWKMIRTTNYLERQIREFRRRTKVMGTFPNDRSAERVHAGLAQTYLNRSS
jgi:putative transposase